jgi:hypothetical protein
VQELPISYTRRSVNLGREYENYAWKVKKDGDTVGVEDPKCANHAMSAICYGLTMFAGNESMYDSDRRARESVQVSSFAGTSRRTGLASLGQMIDGALHGHFMSHSFRDHRCGHPVGNSLRSKVAFSQSLILDPGQNPTGDLTEV